MQKYEIVSPLGRDAVAQCGIAPRLEDLNGRTIGEIWNGMFKGDLVFPLVRRLLQQRYPRIKVVPYTEFPHVYGGDNPTRQKELAQELAALARAKGCDAVISGNGA